MEYCQGGKINDPVYMKENNIPVDEVSLKFSYPVFIFMGPHILHFEYIPNY